MNVEKSLHEVIVNECEKLIARHHSYHNHLHAEWLRNRARISGTLEKQIKTPEYWAADRKFNPFYVKSNAKAIAKSIAKKISEGTYAPNVPFEKLIPKAGGGQRKLTIYQIPDAAVSRYFYSRLLSKNKHRFSSFSYAYRNDRNVHFAIQDIAVDLSQESRTFIAEFDFSDFFGSISHEYLFKQLHVNGFLISKEEEGVIKAFLKTRDKGIPQGTSISLFLANLVCWRLDKSLEKFGLRFARYADDTVIWSPSYSAICESFVLINRFSKEAGVPINPRKSEGISLLTRAGLPAELPSKPAFDFLGYSVGVDEISIKKNAELRIKKQISYLLYKNLIQPLKDKPLRGLVIPSNDKDPALLTAMMQIRRFMYGGLSRREINEYIKGRKKTIHFKGIMSFYPLVNNLEQLRELDGWLLSVIHRSIHLRSRLLITHGFNRSASFPFNIERKDLIKRLSRRRIAGKRLLDVPSFTLIYMALEKGLRESGIERVMHAESSKYGYGDI